MDSTKENNCSSDTGLYQSRSVEIKVLKDFAAGLSIDEILTAVNENPGARKQGVFVHESSTLGDLLSILPLGETPKTDDGILPAGSPRNAENLLLKLIDDARKVGMPFHRFTKMMKTKGIICLWLENDNRCIIYSGKDTDPDFVPYANGLIIDSKDYHTIVPCHRQYVETLNLPENLEDYELQKLYDATSVRLYYYGDEWHVALRRHFDGKKCWWDPRKTFHKMYLDCKVDESKLNKNYVYFASLCHPYNYVLDPKREAKLVINDIIDRETGKNVDISTAEILLEKVKILDSPEKDIGCILVHKTDGSRLIWRDPVYAYRHKMMGNWQDRNYRVIETIKEKNDLEFITMFPEFSVMREKIIRLINEFCGTNPERAGENYIKLMNENVETIARLIRIAPKNKKKLFQSSSATQKPLGKIAYTASSPTLDQYAVRRKTEKINLMDAINAKRPLPKINGRPHRKSSSMPSTC
jgi:hypothetical protein